MYKSTGTAGKIFRIVTVMHKTLQQCKSVTRAMGTVDGIATGALTIARDIDEFDAT